MTVQPEGEDIRQAIKWIDAERREGSGKSLARLMEEAAVRFNLSPLEAESLLRTLSSKTSRS
jgi:hypothetical protein